MINYSLHCRWQVLSHSTHKKPALRTIEWASHWSKIADKCSTLNRVEIHRIWTASVTDHWISFFLLSNNVCVAPLYFKSRIVYHLQQFLSTKNNIFGDVKSQHFLVGLLLVCNSSVWNFLHVNNSLRIVTSHPFLLSLTSLVTNQPNLIVSGSDVTPTIHPHSVRPRQMVHKKLKNQSGIL